MPVTGTVMLRVLQRQIEKLRQLYPELRDLDNTSLVKVCLQKLIESRKGGEIDEI